MAGTKQWLCRTSAAALLYMGILSGSLLGCGGPNHSALCDKALGESHSAGERKDYKQAAQFLDVASKEADLSDSATEKSQVFQDQV
ncbi:MAG TPA: hypothetical protein V6C69_06745, partial [Trichormus sp.]